MTQTNLRRLHVTVAANKDHPKREPGLDFPDVAALLSTIWGKPIELLIFLRRAGSLTPRQLAKDLGRGYAPVQKEVRTLLELGLVAPDGEQKIFVPWDELFIEVPLTK